MTDNQSKIKQFKEGSVQNVLPTPPYWSIMCGVYTQEEGTP